MSETVKRLQGRPRHGVERKERNLTFRARPQMRSYLMEQAAENTRSMSEEIEVRLQRTIDRDHEKETSPSVYPRFVGQETDADRRLDAILSRSLDGSRKRGRPPLGETEKKMNALAFRARPALRAKIDEAAASAGRSVSEEIEFRLSASFDVETRDRSLITMLQGVIGLIEKK